MRIRLLTWRIPLAVVAVVLVAAACGKDSNDTASGSSGGSTATGTTTGSSGSAGGSGSTGGGYSRYGGGNGGGGGNDDSSGGSGSGGVDMSGDAGDVTITANNYSFDPARVSVESGSELYLTNANANTPHTFTIDGTDIDVSLEPMASEDVDIDLDPGTYRYHCKIHPQMTGTLRVT